MVIKTIGQYGRRPGALPPEQRTSDVTGDWKRTGKRAISHQGLSVPRGELCTNAGDAVPPQHAGFPLLLR